MRDDRRRRSARETFSNCAYRYKAEYLDGVDMSSSASRRGSCFHRAKERYIQALWKAHERSDFEAAESALQAALVELPLPYAEELDVRSLWSRFIERFELPLDTFYGVETQTLECFGAKLQFDLVLVPTATTLQVRDSKTHWRLPTQIQLESSYQTHFYLAAMRRLFPGFETYELVYDYERFNESFTVRMTPAQMDQFELTLEAQDEAMARAEDAGDFPATAGTWCSTCQAVCPLSRAGRVEARLRTAQEASQAVQVLSAIRRTSGLLREALAGYVEASGPVEAGGVEWAFRPVERTSYPAKPVVEALAEAKVTYALMLSATAVKSLVTTRKYAHVAPAIKALGVTTIKTEFGPQSVTPTEDTGPEVVE